MSQGQRPTQELSLGDVISKTFQLYRRKFLNYVVLFAVVEAITGALTTVVRHFVIVHPLPTGATPQQLLTALPGYLGGTFELGAFSAIATWVLYPIAYGSAVKMASQEFESGQTDLAASVKFAVSQLLWLWVVGIVVGIIVILGFIALVVPGIILAIMFSLVVPVIIIEKLGFNSLSKSSTRQPKMAQITSAIHRVRDSNIDSFCDCGSNQCSIRSC